MRLLICTQAVDTEDPVLGFFVRWVEEFAKHAEHIEVICLREGKHVLPENVRVHSLGKESTKHEARSTKNRIIYTMRFLRLVWKLRRDYDAAFVHMNPEYVVLGGIPWHAMGKRIALWYTHKSVDLKLCIATFFSNIIFTASKESFRLRSGKVRIMGHGIDTDFFSPDAGIAPACRSGRRGDWMLSVGRLMPSKRHDLAIRRAVREGKELRIAGEGPERANLEALAHSLNANVHFLGGLTQTALRNEYRTANLFLHTSETGSLDKVVLEALACGLPVRTNDLALKALGNANPEYVREHHSLRRLIPAILSII